MKRRERIILILGLMISAIIWLAVESIATTTTDQSPQGNKVYSEVQRRLIQYGFQPLGKTDKLAAIKQAQQTLKDLGYYTSFIDGIIGPKTKKAVLDFQSDVGLEVTGMIDEKTIGYLSRPTLALNFQAENEGPSGVERALADQPVPARVQEPVSSQAESALVTDEDTATTTMAPMRVEPFVAALEASPLASQSLDVIQRVMTLMDEVFPDGGAFQLQVWINKGGERVYAEGDKLLVHVQAETDAYLHVDYYQSDGQVVHLLPHPLDNNRIRAGQVLTLGTTENTFQFEVTPPFGVEVLTVLAFQRPLGVRTDVPSVELASVYLEHLASRFQDYKAHGKAAAASIHLRTHK